MNPLEYWEMASRGGDPIDIKMCELALHYLTPPASSVDIERLFSVVVGRKYALPDPDVLDRYF